MIISSCVKRRGEVISISILLCSVLALVCYSFSKEYFSSDLNPKSGWNFIGQGSPVTMHRDGVDVALILCYSYLKKMCFSIEVEARKLQFLRIRSCAGEKSLSWQMLVNVGWKNKWLIMCNKDLFWLRTVRLPEKISLGADKVHGKLIKSTALRGSFKSQLLYKSSL